MGLRNVRSVIPQRLFILFGAVSAWLFGGFAAFHAQGALLGADGRSVPGSPEPVLVGIDSGLIWGGEQREGSGGDDDPDACVCVGVRDSWLALCSPAPVVRLDGDRVNVRHTLGSRGPPV